MEPIEQQQLYINNDQKNDQKKNGSSRYVQGFFTGIAAMFLVSLLVVLIGSKAGFIQLGHSRSSAESVLLSDETINKIDWLYAKIQAQYYEDIDENALVDGIYHGLLDGLGDPYSVYYTQEEYENMMISTTGNYYGIGAVLSQDPDTMNVTISHIYDNTPAKKAGLKSGDTLVKVDEIEASSMELTQLVTHIRGEEGTTVHLVVYRKGDKDYLEFDVERAQVDIPTVSSKMLTEDVGYIEVAEFSEKTPEQFEQAIAELQSAGMKKMIIDLRDNGGGLLESCRQMLDDILPEGVVVYTEDKYGERNDYYSDGSSHLEIPLVVLINGNSASASEIFAGAIRDYDYGTLIGTTTFGKGIVQNVEQLRDGSAIKLTIAKYFTPNGDYIHGVGIDPHLEVEYEYTGEDDEPYDEMKDSQVLKAIEVLSGN
ncbi:MAG: S41 family peptidase [Lachnospiraceae bacterium]|nr:S41 family peptidase [Lachnospiraceae bacterium]